MTMEILAIIPARGGSKGIPKKNIREIDGKPLIAYTIEVAKKSKYISRVFVSTDSEEIAEVAKRHGAEVPFLRCKEMSTDDIPVLPTLAEHLIKLFRIKENYIPEMVVILQPTCPLRTSEQIDEGVERFLKGDCDWVTTVNEAKMHPYRTRFMGEEGKLISLKDDPTVWAQRQELPKAFTFNGAIFITTPEKILSGKTLSEQTWVGIEIPKEDSIDIDDEEDLILLEKEIKKRKLKKDRENKVAIRVNGDNITGMGHIIRCLTLVKELEKKGNFFFNFIINKNNAAKEKIEERGYEVKILEEESLEETINIIEKINPDLLIVDLLDIDNNYLEPLKNRVKLSVCLLDEHEKKTLCSDIVMNHSILQKEEFYSDETNSYKVGPKYVLLEENFKERGTRDLGKVENIFINQGGSDPYNLTSKTLIAIDNLINDKKVDVVIGPAFKHYKEFLKTLANLKNKKNINLEYDISSERMASLMRRTDIALTAAGNTLYELSNLGIPSIAICHHPKHNKVAAEFQRKGAIINLGIGTEIDEKIIADSIGTLINEQTMRQTLRENAIRLVDGKGAERLVKEILEKINN